MNDLDRLLSALHATPGDDTLWLALADCLEEQGEPQRAELTRLTLWGRTRQDAPEVERKAWGERQRALLASGVLPCVPEVVNSIGMRFALIPAGTFLMGSPEEEEGRDDNETQHEVEITQAFYLGVHVVTQAEYQRVMKANPSQFKQGDTYPVEEVSWNDAVEFCRRLSPRRKEGGRVYRLLTEAEWEYACRGGTPFYQTFHVGNSLSSTQANFDGNRPYGGDAKGESREKTVAVDSFVPNAFGLWQMHGNVWEWCNDWFGFGEDYYASSPRQDPPGPARNLNRVFRGGSWCSYGSGCRSAIRHGSDPDARCDYLGFRVALGPPVRKRSWAWPWWT